jgi:hypothetical protein
VVKVVEKKEGGGREEGEDIADFSLAIVGPDSISSRETRIHRCAECSERVCGKRLRWSRGSVLAFGTQVRGFKPDRSRRILRAKKKSFGGEVKPSVPCHSFMACKRFLNVT